MRIYCVTRASWGGMRVWLACTKEIALVHCAKRASEEGYIEQLYCRVYDDVGVQVDEGYLYRTAKLGKVDLSIG